jgi:hypothetical protein
MERIRDATIQPYETAADVQRWERRLIEHEGGVVLEQRQLGQMIRTRFVRAADVVAVLADRFRVTE